VPAPGRVERRGGIYVVVPPVDPFGRGCLRVTRGDMWRHMGHWSDTFFDAGARSSLVCWLDLPEGVERRVVVGERNDPDNAEAPTVAHQALVTLRPVRHDGLEFADQLSRPRDRERPAPLPADDASDVDLGGTVRVEHDLQNCVEAEPRAGRGRRPLAVEAEGVNLLA
jgi:hypothetical protein